jgi:hypothetical protein
MNEWILHYNIWHRLLCVLQVYAGGTEFSFEELRAIEYLKHNRSAQHKQGKNISIIDSTYLWWGQQVLDLWTILVSIVLE